MFSTHEITLKDGRVLAYGEHGDAQGRPVLFFHGTPGSRMMRHPDESIAASLGARIITIDRPGYGLSDFKPQRRLLDWPDDVTELACALSLDRFAVAGFSGGGPYAASCAFQIPSRLTAVALISSVGPFDLPNATNGIFLPARMLLRFARNAPWLLRMIAWPFVRTMHRNFERYLDCIAARMPECDRSALQRRGIRNVFRESFEEVFRSGSHAASKDMSILAHPWGFRLQDMQTKIYLWHGEQDRFYDGKLLASLIPNCHATILPAEGHLLLFTYWKEILTQLL